jgi:hypothetical protein
VLHFLAVKIVDTCTNNLTSCRLILKISKEPQAEKSRFKRQSVPSSGRRLRFDELHRSSGQNITSHSRVSREKKETDNMSAMLKILASSVKLKPPVASGNVYSMT